MEAIGPLRGAQPLVDLQKQLADVFDNILADFLQVSEVDAVGQHDRQSADLCKHRLLQHLHATRQQLLRAVVLINWKPWKVLTELVDHERVLDIAASHVRTMHEVVGQMRQQAAGRIMAGSYLNMYDVNTALEVLTTGTYQELPSIILHRPPLFQPPPASLARQRSRLAHVTQLIRSRLVQMPLPPGLKVVSISNGAVVLRAEGLYEAKLTLVPSEPLPGIDAHDAAATAGGAAAAGPGPSAPPADCEAAVSGWAAAAAAAAAADPIAAAAAAQRWKWRLIHFVLLIGVPFYDPRQPGQILNTCNFHMVLAADNAAYLRHKRQQAGGAAVAPAHSTRSESGATPAASGLPQPGGGGGGTPAGGGGVGGTLAAAVRRSEDDEVGAPLAVMHAILSDVAGRLLVDELAAAARALAAPGSRWHGHINVKPSQRLHPGVRIEYWVTAPPLLSLRALPPPAPGEDFRHVKPGPPYLELGMGDSGRVEVLHAPSSLHKPMEASKLRLDTFRVNLEEVLMRAAIMSSMFQLLLIRSELKANLVEAMGKRAPTTRLTTLARQLWCREGAAAAQQQQGGHSVQAGDASQQSLLRGGLGHEDDDMGEQLKAGQQRDAAAGGVPAAASLSPDAAGTAATPMELDGPSAAAPLAVAVQQAPIAAPTAPPPEVSGLLARVAPPEEAAGALVVLNAPVLEYLVSGTTELKIGKHLFSGRLTLRPGQDERDEGSLDHAAAIAMHEDYVNQAALSAYNTAAASADPYPACRALKEACIALCHVLQRTHTSTDATHFIQAARRAALHISTLPRGMLEAFSAASPGLTVEPGPREKVATWALQSVPFPANFPPLEPVSPDTPALRVPQCLSFFLQSRLSLASPHALVVCSCTKQLMPIKVLSCIPVPPSTYSLPEHVYAAYMAAASHHHGSGGTSHAHHHIQSSGGGNHSLPHSRANSPRAMLNGHEAGGHSPDSPPLRESAAGAVPTRGAPLQGRMSVGGAGAAATMVAAACTGSDAACAGGGAAAAASGLPSLPFACSPPQPHSNSKLASSSGPANTSASTRGGGGGPGPSGRPTGQQVAVMLAQQQLSSVVRWCRQRMVWEVLLVQLQAVGAAFDELCTRGPCQRLRVTRVAGTQLPCLIARRRGLTPARVGPTCLELELGPDALAGQVTARLYGRFLCSPACAPPHAPHVDDARGGQLTSGFVQAAVPSLSQQQEQAGTAAGAGAGSDGGIVCLRRRYCLERGDSALTLLQEVCAIIRTQTLLARLEMTALPVPVRSSLPASSRSGRLEAQRLAVLAPLPPMGPSAASGDAAGQSQDLHPCYRTQRSRPRLPSPAAQPPHPYGSQPDMKLAAAGGQGHRYGHPLKAAHGHEASDGAAGSGGLGRGGTAAGGSGAYGSPHPAKRIKTEPGSEVDEQASASANGIATGWDGWQQGGLEGQGHGRGHAGGNHLANGIAGGPGTGSRARGASNGQPWRTGEEGRGAAEGTGPAAGPPPVLTWHWPLVGTLTLEEYSFNAATIRVSPCTIQQASVSPSLAPPAGGDAAVASALPPPPLQLHITWAPRDVRHLHGSNAAAPPPPPPQQSPAGFTPTPAVPSPLGAALPSPLAAAPTPSPYSTSPTPGSLLTAQTPQSSGMLPQDAVVTTTRNVTSRMGEAFGHLFADLVLCTVSCSSGHSLPPEYLHVLEEFAEAGEEGKLLDAVAVASWPLAGFCSALRPAVMTRYGLAPESDARLTLHQPPYCHRIVCRRRSAPGHLLIDLVCQAVGRSYVKLSLPSLLPGQPQAQQKQQQSDAAAEPGAGPATPEGALQAVQQLAVSRLGPRGVHVSVGGRAAMYSGLGPRPPAVPGPGSPLWLLVPNDCVQQAVEIALSVL